MDHGNVVPPPPPRGEKRNIIVLGGGVSGTLSTFELTRAGHDVTLIEAGDFGNGSSSRSAACIRQQFGTESTVRGMIYCVRYYKCWREIMGGSEVPIAQNGYLFLYDPRTYVDRLKARVDVQHRAGLLEVEFLSREELDTRFGKFDLNTFDIVGATWCPTDGFLYPNLVYADSAAAAVRLGAKIVRNARVVAVEKNGDRAVAVRTEDGRAFKGDLFVNACGVWSPQVSNYFGGWPVDVKARRRYLYILDGIPRGMDFKNLPMTITPRGCYCRPENASGSTLMAGWLHATNPTQPAFDEQDLIQPDFGINSSFAIGVQKEMAAYLPSIGDMGIKAVTAGYYEDTPDCNPLIGFDPWIKNLIHVAGFSGHGLMHAPYSARIVAELVAAGANINSIELPGIGRVDIKTFHVDRDFTKSSHEDMVI